MKFKRFLSVLLAIMIAVCVSSILTVNYASAEGETGGTTSSEQTTEPTSSEQTSEWTEPVKPEPIEPDPVEPTTPTTEVYRISAVKYDLETLLEDLGVKPLDGKTKVTDGRTISYRLSVNAKGEAVAETDSNKEAAFKTLSDSVEFLSQGTYTIAVKEEGTDATTDYYVSVRNKVVAVDEEYNNTSVSYKADVTGYMDAVKQNSETLKTGDNFDVPSIEDYIDSVDFEYDKLQKIVYYCAPNSSSYTQGSAVTTTDPSFKVSYRGTYSFYILFKDPFTNTMKTDDLVEGEGGWYKKDADGNKVGEVVIPVFTFTVKENAAPEVTVRASEDAYLNLSYEIESFIITANGGNREYNLYFSTEYFDKDDEKFATDDDYMKAVIAKSENITEDYLNESSLTFTPDKVGYYYVQVKVVDDYNMAETAMSRAINCVGEAKSVEWAYAPDTLSIVFLSIAGVCFVALIVVLLIKPKEVETVEVKEKETKTK